MFDLLLTGVILGLSAGLAPGPLLTLVIAETLRHGTGGGIRVALAPLITDLPIILLALFVLHTVAGARPVLGVISLVGGAFLLAMGYENLRSGRIPVDPDARAPASLTKGILANILNPHPYLFWFSVGGPLMSRAMAQQPAAPVFFLVGFFSCLIGSKVLLAVLVGRSRAMVTGRPLIAFLRFIGIVLCVLAFSLFRDGLTLLGLLPAAA